MFEPRDRSISGAEEVAHDGPQGASVDRLQAARRPRRCGRRSRAWAGTTSCWPRWSSTCSTPCRSTGPTTVETLAVELELPGRPPAIAARRRGGPGPARPVRRCLRAQRHRQALPGHRRPGVDGIAHPGRPGPHENWTRLADTVRNGQGRPRPSRTTPAAFYVPLVEGTFTTMFRCATRADLKIRYSAQAGGRGCSTSAPAEHRGRSPSSTAAPTGTAVVNDLDGVIGVAQAKTAEHGVADRCEFRPGDFHDDRHRDECLRHRRARPRVPDRGRRGCSPPDRAGVPGAQARGPPPAGRLLPRHGAQVQPPRRADGHDDDGQHREGLHLHPPRLLRMAHRGRVSWPSASSSRSASNRPSSSRTSVHNRGVTKPAGRTRSSAWSPSTC